ncbi:Lrp/AsnC family transcriptional regulator [Halomonas halocynthiae]|uniref:Lrp/AsnC family transcriptional regulator n=1 Tax=Halomonas halocynthiae TaxID=176290 RepID=UPI000419B421|nr:Lrp/AsnC family transcriptional regulator [Halomonas halocynthiae]
MIAFDRFDVKILYELQRDASMTLGVLSEAVNLSTSQCSRRITRLQQEGVILGYSLRLDPLALNLKVTAFIFLSMDKGLLISPHDAVAGLLAWDEVVECHTVTGSYDYILKVVVENLAALSAFLSDVVSPMHGVRDITTQVAMNILKSNGPLKLDMSAVTS